uniref:Transmembrane protein n=1 Tax=Timema monikensis TaxID=170555 RepID=A0A7R9HTK3_9NEOP|nr:unnamed protein product [Timema monikensis]
MRAFTRDGTARMPWSDGVSRSRNGAPKFSRYSPSNASLHAPRCFAVGLHGGLASPSVDRPDFTLDVHSAERLMRKIKAAKRRRCWCRLVTSLLGLVFFLVSVMVVSLLYTRGERIFGSL